MRNRTILNFDKRYNQQMTKWLVSTRFSKKLPKVKQNISLSNPKEFVADVLQSIKFK